MAGQDARARRCRGSHGPVGRVWVLGEGRGSHALFLEGRKVPHTTAWSRSYGSSVTCDTEGEGVEWRQGLASGWGGKWDLMRVKRFEKGSGERGLL